jgi:hypothetical protein
VKRLHHSHRDIPQDFTFQSDPNSFWILEIFIVEKGSSLIFAMMTPLIKLTGFEIYQNYKKLNMNSH